MEVKATNGTSKSLNKIVSEADYEDVKYGIKLGDTNIGKSQKFVTFPYAITFLLKRWIRERILLHRQGINDKIITE